MAHKLNIRANGIASFASRKEKAWHGLGTVVDAMTSEDAIKLGGLDFVVEKRPVLYLGGKALSFEEAKGFTSIARKFTVDESTQKQVPNYYRLYEHKDKFNTVRADTNQALGVVGSKYHIIQNSEAFDFIDSIIGKGVAEYETVGALGNGETVFITCKLKDGMVINKEDIDKYLLISMSHDGSSSITVMFTPIRVVCNNTLSLALKGNLNKYTIRHTQNANAKLEHAKTVLGLVDKQTMIYNQMFEALTTIKVSDMDAKYIMEKSLKIERDIDGELSTRAQNILHSCEDYYHIGAGQENIIGTGWGVFNGITGYLQNAKEYSNSEQKFKNTFMTSGVTTRIEAYNNIMSLV